MITGIDHIEVRVRDLDRSLGMYRDVLGLREAGRGPGQAGRPRSYLVVGPSLLELQQDPGLQPATDRASGEPITSMYDDTAWVSHFAFPMVDAQARHAELGARGIAWPFEPVDQPAGHHLVRRRLLEWTDPDYLLVQFAEIIDQEGHAVPPSRPSVAGAPWPGCDRFDHMMLNAPDMAAKRAFYVETLGLPATEPRATRLGQQCDVTVGETVVELTWQARVTSPLHMGGISRIGLAVDDLEQTAAELRARGVELSGMVREEPITGLRRRMVDFRDPDGVTLALVQRIESLH
jgi:catechol 2,3-dioxygenase-like lactoylglutathione lyase family enzyme